MQKFTIFAALINSLGCQANSKLASRTLSANSDLSISDDGMRWRNLQTSLSDQVTEEEIADLEDFIADIDYLYDEFEEHEIIECWDGYYYGDYGYDLIGTGYDYGYYYGEYYYDPYYGECYYDAYSYYYAEYKFNDGVVMSLVISAFVAFILVILAVVWSVSTQCGGCCYTDEECENIRNDKKEQKANKEQKVKENQVIHLAQAGIPGVTSIQVVEPTNIICISEPQQVIYTNQQVPHQSMANPTSRSLIQQNRTVPDNPQVQIREVQWGDKNGGQQLNLQFQEKAANKTLPPLSQKEELNQLGLFKLDKSF